MNSLWRFCSALVVLVLLVAAPGCAPVAPPPPDCRSEQVTCVGLVTDLNGVQDFGLNEQIWQMLVELRSEGIVSNRIESVDQHDYRKNLAFFCDQGYDFVVLSGYELAEIALEMYEAYPNVNFILVGQPPPEEDFPANVAWVIFPEEKAGRWAGALAAHFSESRLVGAIFAHPEIPAVQAYARGFEAGVQAANGLAAAQAASEETIESTETPVPTPETAETPTPTEEATTTPPVEELTPEPAETPLAPATASLVFYDSESDFATSLSEIGVRARPACWSRMALMSYLLMGALRPLPPCNSRLAG